MRFRFCILSKFSYVMLDGEKVSCGGYVREQTITPASRIFNLSSSIPTAQCEVFLRFRRNRLLLVGRSGIMVSLYHFNAWSLSLSSPIFHGASRRICIILALELQKGLGIFRQSTESVENSPALAVSLWVILLIFQ